MKKLFLTGLLLCISMIGICQVRSMGNGEYYLDTDPGVGNGVVLTVANTDSINQTVTVNTSSLTAGFHRVYLRYKDSVGHWGNTMSYLFTVLSTSSSGGALVIPLVKGEYFLDTDPGAGNGTAISSFSNADSVNQTISVNTTGLSAGFHRVYLRYKDSLGFWGNTQSYLFSVLSTSSSGGALVIPLVAGEYFMDTDPGTGNGTAISSFSNADSVNQTISVSTTGLSVGFHRVYFRYKDSVGFWGNTQSYLFSVLSTSSSGGNVTVPVSTGEYFVDTDPGPGNGTPFSSFSNADSVSQNVSVNTSGLTTGFHRVYVRYRDSVGHWGNPSNYLFTVTTPVGASSYPPIVAGEYFIDMADPGPGNGTPFGSFVSADSLTQNLSINTSSMTNGSHSLFVRFVDSTGHWGEVSPVVFSICANSPGIINGTTTLCIGSFTTLTDTSAGGTWSSSNTAVATIGTNGTLTGISSGNAQITYAVTTSCGNVFQVANVTIEALTGLAPISGVGSVCVGATTTLTDTGGVWSSANGYYATVGTNGVVTGQNAGTVVISYTSTNVCGTAVQTAAVTVNPLPATPPAIAGTTSVCKGNTSLLSDATSGGTWSSNNTSVASVGSGGLVSGVAVGSAIITYKVINGCGSAFITAVVSVLVIPTVNAISGTSTLCAGSSITLGDITGGGSWNSSNTAIATVNSSGQVTGVAAGSVTISYTVTNICGSTSATLIMSINPLPVSPAAITGVSLVCSGANITLSDISGGGIWSSSNTAIASVASTGVVTGVASGTATVSYSEINGCGSVSAAKILTVDQLPNAGSISGTATICIGSTTGLSDPVSGTAAWSSGNTSIATVGSSGIVTGIGGGSASISYAVINNCGTSYATYVVTIDTVITTAGTITGPGAVCPGSNINLTDVLSGGVWTASNTNVVVTDLGLVHGIAAGTATVSYSVSNVCGTYSATSLIDINPLPVAGIINGVGSVCLASPVTFTDTSSGGVWSSSNSAIASVGSNTGVVTGLFPGTATIIYSVTNSCGTSNDIKSLVVNPYAGIISGPNSVTTGVSANLSETVSGGVWSSSNTEVATIGSSSGVVTGVILGYTTISYTVAGICGTAVDTMQFAVGYCIPDHDSAAASLREGIIIGKFVFAGLVDSLIDFSRPNGTTNYEDLTATYTAYASVNSTVICGIRDSLGPGSAQVYIDFNNDEIFEPSESVGGMSSVDNVITAFNVTIPTYADTGMHRMRVIFSYGGGTYGGGTYPNLNPCAVSLYGDVRDYSVYIQNYPIFLGGSAPMVRACMNTPTPIDTVLSVFNQAVGDAEQWTVLSYPYHGTLSGFPETRTTTGGVVTPTGLSYTGAYGYNGDDEFTIRVYDGARYTDASVHVVDGISSIVGAIVIDTASSLALTDSTTGGTWSSNNTTIATINPTTGVATAGLINGVAIITYALTDTVCGSIYTTTELPVVAEACYPSFINSPASKTDDVSLQGFAITGELGTYINDFVPCNGTDNYENLDSTFTVTLNKNTTYPVNFPGNSSESIQVWIDFNNNGVFEASEVVGGGTWPYYGQNHITIGRHVPTGIFRMRIVANAPQYPIHDTTGQYYPDINPCDFYVQYGDGRDYNVVIDSLNHPPHFARTFRVPDLNNICMNSGAINIDSMLAITDIDSGQTETWTVLNAGHGTFGGFNNTQISNGGLVIDSGLTYTPDTGFSGYDQFIVQVSDGFATDVITIGVHVGLPDPGVIYADGTCNGDPHEVYTGYSCLGLYDYIGYHLRGFDQSYSFPPGIWTSSDTAVATVDSVTGTVTGVSPGTTTITYTVTDGCGTTYTTYEVIDIPPPVIIPCDCPPPPPPPPPPPACISAYFVNGFYQNLTVCAGTINNNIDSLLTINDANNNLTLTETWYVGAAPLHGTLGGFNYSVGTVGGMATPAGLSYTPDSGFTGHDAFAVYISNGICTPYWTYISVLVGPYAGIITGDSIFAMGSPDTLLYDAEPDGIWTSSNANVADVSIFSIGRYGILSFISPGNSVITYTVDNFCGEASTTHPIRVDNDNVYLKGRYVQLGIAPNGSFGSTLDAPYYFNANAPDIAYWDPEACYSDTSFRKLGMVYDFGHNGWTTGSPAYFGDYVVHGVPQEGWSVSLDGVTSSAFNYNYQYLCSGYTGWFNTSASHNAGATLVNSTATATWQGKIDSANRHFTITQTTQLDTNASWVLMTTKIVNNGVTVNNVFFNRTISPKNDLGEAGSLITTNKISSSLPQGEEMVYANGTVYSNAFIGLATRDSRAKAYIIDSGILTMDSLAKIWLGTSPYLLSGSDTAAAAVGLVYNLGTIGAGDSVSFTYAYIFDDTTGIDSVFANPELMVGGSTFQSSDTITSCNIHSHTTADTTTFLIAGVVNGGDYTWQWTPSTGLVVDTGVDNVILLNDISGKLVYTITGTSNSVGDTVKKVFNIVINTTPPANNITGDLMTCVGVPDTLGDTVTGGVWSSVNTGVASITPYRGYVTGIAAGTTTISYVVSNACGSTTATTVLTVNSLLAPGNINGPGSVCVGATISLSDTGTGVWSSASPGVAAIGSTGIVTGVSGGTAIVSFTTTNLCGSSSATYVVTVTPLPYTGSISGNSSVCTGSSIQLTDGVSGGSWSSANSAVATINTYGSVMGVAGGTATVSYTLANSCGSSSATDVITVVSSVPDAGTISGPTVICQAASAQMSDAAPNGLWSSSNSAIILITNGGQITGQSGGTATISYTVSNSCGSAIASLVITVNPLPASPGLITGTFGIYVDSATLLSDTTNGGVWSSGNSSVASVDSSGLVTGVAIGTARISYTITNACGSVRSVRIVTVDPLPGTDIITGTMAFCAGATSALTDTLEGGAWSSSNTYVATVNAVTGVVTGLSGGTSTISYNNSGIIATTVLTVYAVPDIYPSVQNPSICGGTNGELIIGGLQDDTTYSIYYTLDGVVYSGSYTAVGPGQITIGSLSTADTVREIYIQTSVGCLTNALAGPFYFESPSVASINISNQNNPTTCGGNNGYITINDLVYDSTYTLYYTQNGVVNSGPVVANTFGTVTINSLSASDTISHIYFQTSAGCYTDTLSGPYHFVNPLPPYVTVDNETNPTICNGNNGYLTIGGGLAFDTTYTLYYTENGAAHSAVVVASNFGSVTIGSLSAFDTVRDIYLQTSGGCYTDTLAGPYALSNPSAPYLMGVGQTNPSLCDGSNGYLIVEGGLTADTTYTLYYSENGVAHSESATASEFGITIASLSAADTIRYIYLQTSGGCYTDSLVGPYYFTNPSPPYINVNFENNPTICNGSNGYITIGGGLANDTTYTLYYSENGVLHSDVVVASNFGSVTIGSLSALDTIRNIYMQTSGGCYTDTIAGPYFLVNPAAPDISEDGQANPTVCDGSNGSLTIAGGLTEDSTYTLFYTENGIVHSGLVTPNSFDAITIGSLSAADTIRYIYLRTSGGCYTDSVVGPYYFTSPSAPYINVNNETNPSICNGNNGYLKIGGGLMYDTTYTLYYTDNGTARSEVVTANNFGSVTIGSLSAFDTVRDIYLQTSAGCYTDTVDGPYFLSNPSAPYIMGVNPTNPSVCDGSNGALLVEGEFTADTTYILYYTENGVAHSGSVTAGSSGITIGSLSASDTVRNIYVETTGGCFTDSADGPYRVTNPSPPYISLAYETYPTICNGSNGYLTFGGGLMPDTAYTLYYTDNGVMQSQVITANTFGSIVLGSLSAFDTIRNVYLQIPGGCYTDTIAGPYALNNPLPPDISVVNETNPGMCGGNNGIIGIAGGLYQDTSYTLYYKENGVSYITAAVAVSGNEILFDSLSALDTISEIYVKTSAGCYSNILASSYYLSNPSVPNISGPNSVCLGSTVTLSDYVANGTWSSSANVTIDGSGDATGVSGGTAIITYYLGVGCLTTTTMTVNTSANAGSIVGATTVSVGSNITLTDAVAGGTWTASNGNATVSSGVVHGVAAGTVIISYTVTNSCGTATATSVISVTGGSILPIAGLQVVCAGSSITLSDATTGGTWSSGATSVATVGSASGIVSGINAGTATITYTKSAGFVTTVVTVNPLPSGIAGARSVCVGSVTSLSDATLGGTWAKSNVNATVDGSGDVTGVTAGTVFITYTLVTGCYTSAVVTVNPLPAIITGSNSVCIGSTVTVNDATSGGLWSSVNTSIATIGSATHIVTAIAAGVDNIVYTLSTGCSRSYSVTVNPISAILGSSTVCVGSTILLTDATGTGVWSSGSTVKATIGSVSGIVTGIASGTSKITYTSPAGCIATEIVSVNPITSILGNASVCQGSTTSLSDVTAGGTWMSGNTSIAYFSGTSGVVSGITPGSTTVTYTIASTGCVSSTTLFVNPITPIIGAPASVCVGGTVTLSDATAGGVWSSSTSTRASVGSLSGIVTGVSSGTGTITYLVTSTGCRSTATVSVAPISAILGTTVMCSASTITLSDATTGGIWTSSNTAVATIGASGSPVTVAGVSPGGITTITYATSSCSASMTLTVNQSPVIGGSHAVCAGLTTVLTNNISGGTWTSSNTTKATVDASGDVTGLVAGTSIISYMAITGCSANVVVSVYANPAAILGGSVVCTGNVLSLSDATSGGSWSTSAGVSLTGSGGSVMGVTAGSSAISYTLSGGCLVTKTITVATPPTAISGGNSICAGNTLQLSDGVSGGTWTSSNTSNATIGSNSGLLTGMQNGTANITYTTASGCYAATVITVNAIQAITGGTGVCTGNTLSLSDMSSGGTWSTSSTNITVGSTGIVTGISAGTATVVYTLPSGCSRSVTISVNSSPTPIAGVLSVCAGATTFLSDDGSGTWTMSSIIATIAGSTGVVTTSSSYTGTATVTYTAGAGCVAMAVVTVSPNPTAIQGMSTECAGATISLSDATGGGTWTGFGDATVSGSGSAGVLVAGAVAGTATIVYTLPTGCYVTSGNTIRPNPAAIQGVTNICVGGVTILSDATSGAATWSSGNTAVASAAGGDITGMSAGIATITYLLNTGCFTITTVNVLNASAITGNTGAICPNTTLSLTDVGATGTWSSSNTVVASVGTDGTVTSYASGTATITFVTAGVSGCVATTVVTVSSTPTITGASSLCANTSITLNDASGGGAWSSGNTSVAVVSSAGVVSGLGTGTVAISYTAITGCTVISTITVNAAPGAINGNTSICIGAPSALTDATGGGVWSSSVTGHATVGGSTGLVTGITAGSTSTITYTAAGCFVTTTVSINAQPGAILGASAVCAAATISLSNTTPGGSWTSTGVGSVGSTGLFSGGLVAGTTTVSYTTAAGCGATDVVTTNPVPGILAGPAAMCAGTTIMLSDAVTGGTWSPSSGLVTVDATGDVTAVNAASGTVTVTYTLPGGCFITSVITVTNIPSAILGVTSVCSGLTISLSNSSAGGVWSSSNTAVATIGSGGLLTGVGTGVVTITYTVGSGCTTSETVTVNALPEAITGATTICEGTTSALADTGSGAWSITPSLFATINSVGVVTASATYTGTTTVTYTADNTGCKTTAVITVVGRPTPIQGSSAECAGLTITITDVTAGGTWSGTGDATVSGAGTAGTLVAGAVAGSATVTYTMAAGCYITFNNTIYAHPQPILGNFNMCVGLVTDLSDASPVMSWSSSNTAIAIASGPDISGEGVGTATITFKTSATGNCIATQVVTVSAMPVVTAINGPATISHAGGAVTISDVTAGGVWTSSNSAVIALGGSTGSPVSATALISTGSSVIGYAVTNSGCTTKVTKTIGAAAASHPQGETATILAGSAVSVADDVAGGMWSSSDNGIAAVDGDGLVTGVMPGRVVITHEFAEDGVVARSMTNVVVTALPANISVLPNPNKGIFTVKGTVGSIADEPVTLEVTDLLGQVIYRSNVVAEDGRINETIMLNDAANGMYILNVKSGTVHDTFHFVIEQ